jgi:hypothetical protein
MSSKPKKQQQQPPSNKIITTTNPTPSTNVSTQSSSSRIKPDPQLRQPVRIPEVETIALTYPVKPIPGDYSKLPHLQPMGTKLFFGKNEELMIKSFHDNVDRFFDMESDNEEDQPNKSSSSTTTATTSQEKTTDDDDDRFPGVIEDDLNTGKKKINKSTTVGNDVGGGGDDDGDDDDDDGPPGLIDDNETFGTSSGIVGMPIHDPRLNSRKGWTTTAPPPNRGPRIEMKAIKNIPALEPPPIPPVGATIELCKDPDRPGRSDDYAGYFGIRIEPPENLPTPVIKTAEEKKKEVPKAWLRIEGGPAPKSTDPRAAFWNKRVKMPLNNQKEVTGEALRILQEKWKVEEEREKEIKTPNRNNNLPWSNNIAVNNNNNITPPTTTAPTTSSNTTTTTSNSTTTAPSSNSTSSTTTPTSSISQIPVITPEQVTTKVNSLIDQLKGAFNVYRSVSTVEEEEIKKAVVDVSNLVRELGNTLGEGIPLLSLLKVHTDQYRGSSKNSVLDAHIARDVVALHQRIAMTAREIEYFNAENTRLEKEVNELMSTETKKTAEVTEKKTQVEEWTTKADEAQAISSSLALELEASKKELRDQETLVKKTKGATKDVDYIKVFLRESEGRMSDLIKRNKALSDQIEARTQNKSKTESIIHQCERDYTATLQSISEVKKSLTELRKERDKTDQELSVAENKFKTMEQSATKAKERRDMLYREQIRLQEELTMGLNNNNNNVLNGAVTTTTTNNSARSSPLPSSSPPPVVVVVAAAATTTTKSDPLNKPKPTIPITNSTTEDECVVCFSNIASDAAILLHPCTCIKLCENCLFDFKPNNPPHTMYEPIGIKPKHALQFDKSKPYFLCPNCTQNVKSMTSDRGFECTLNSGPGGVPCMLNNEIEDPTPRHRRFGWTITPLNLKTKQTTLKRSIKCETIPEWRVDE